MEGGSRSLFILCTNTGYFVYKKGPETKCADDDPDRLVSSIFPFSFHPGQPRLLLSGPTGSRLPLAYLDIGHLSFFFPSHNLLASPSMNFSSIYPPSTATPATPPTCTHPVGPSFCVLPHSRPHSTLGNVDLFLTSSSRTGKEASPLETVRGSSAKKCVGIVWMGRRRAFLIVFFFLSLWNYSVENTVIVHLFVLHKTGTSAVCGGGQ